MQLEPSKALNRRKKICRDWYNHQWLSRLLGVVSWLADGKDTFNVARTTGCQIVISGVPTRLRSTVGIDEAALTPLHVDEDAEIAEDESAPLGEHLIPQEAGDESE
jgi:hypothetical protein